MLKTHFLFPIDAHYKTTRNLWNLRKCQIRLLMFLQYEYRPLALQEYSLRNQAVCTAYYWRQEAEIPILLILHSSWRNRKLCVWRCAGRVRNLDMSVTLALHYDIWIWETRLMLKGKKMVKHLDLQHVYKSSSSTDVMIQTIYMNFWLDFGCVSQVGFNSSYWLHCYSNSRFWTNNVTNFPKVNGIISPLIRHFRFSIFALETLKFKKK